MWIPAKSKRKKLSSSQVAAIKYLVEQKIEGTSNFIRAQILKTCMRWF